MIEAAHTTALVRRRPGWELALEGYVHRTMDQPFRFGMQDCATWAMGAVDAMCGTQLRGRFAGYHDAFTAGVMLQRHGWRTLLEAASEVLGVVPETRPPVAGEVLFFDPTTPWINSTQPGAGLLAIAYHAVYAPGRRGLVCQSLRAAARYHALVLPVRW